MTDLVEKVARAMCENALSPKQCPCFGKPFKCADAHPAAQARVALRVVREALAESDEAMTTGGYEALRTYNARDSSEQGRCRRIFAAMLAASSLGRVE